MQNCPGFIAYAVPDTRTILALDLEPSYRQETHTTLENTIIELKHRFGLELAEDGAFSDDVESGSLGAFLGMMMSKIYDSILNSARDWFAFGMGVDEQKNGVIARESGDDSTYCDVVSLSNCK